MGLFEPVGLELQVGGIGGAPANDGDEVAIPLDAVDVIGEDGLDTPAESIAGDGVAYLSGDDDSYFEVRERFICEGAENNVATAFGLAVLPSG